ncbi:Phospholipid-binding Copine Family Protein [Giardia muris]|uniref:Phospholipid-binding Copine Family Protein n=1 Tax=Giardia muris TaxID=5742 RepID=A0A4Z1T6F3_GIAMU|nr:Phospholipid-binding Copine Family Protein [Giardia muris]|eukprot:TNJ28051.1 Phospholipid-binding Copine Family Protein [Giardia muris]
MNDNVPDYERLDQLIASIRQVGVTRMQMIVGIDYSKSNEWTGERSYGHKLHDLSVSETPYEKVIRIMSLVVHEFDEDDIYPVYRFGCVNTRGSSVLPLMYPSQEDPHFAGFDGVCTAYRQITPHIRMSGPTTFGPLIAQAIEISKVCPGQMFILLILTDGDVVDVELDMKMIAEASTHPIVIVAVGLGDGPFEKMDQLANTPNRRFSNFTFVNFTALESSFVRCEYPELILAAHLFKNLPKQFLCMKKLGICG